MLGLNVHYDSIPSFVDFDRVLRIHSTYSECCLSSDEKMSRDQAVLVFSHMGFSTNATIIIAYLMRLYTWPLAVRLPHFGIIQVLHFSGNLSALSSHI